MIRKELIASVDEKANLLRFVHDRVSDNLQTLASLLSIQANRSADPNVQKILDESQQRLNSLVLIHENLHESQSLRTVSMDAYLDSLVTSLYRSCKPEGVNVLLEKSLTN